MNISIPWSVQQMHRRPADTLPNTQPGEKTPDRVLRLRAWGEMASRGLTPQRVTFVRRRLLPDLCNRMIGGPL